MTSNEHEFPQVMYYLDRLGAGGVERVTLNLLAGLAARGWRPTLVLNQAVGELATQRLPAGVELVVLGATSFAGAVRALGALVAQRRPAVLVSQRAYLNLVATLALGPRPGPTKLVLAEHSLLTRWWADRRVAKRRADAVVRRVLPMVYMRADALVAPSRGTAADHARILGRLHPKIRVLPNPIVGPELATRGEEPLVDPPPMDLPWVVAVGRLDPEKNLGAMVEALPRARLLLVGDGPERARIAARAEALGVTDRVHFLGFQPNPYVWIRRARVLAMSSLFETFPTVLVEAMALGTPVVSFDCPEGPREIITHGQDGLLARPEDPTDLGRHLAAVLADERLAGRLRQGGLARAEDFTYARTVPAYEALFEEMAARRRIAR